MILDKKKLLQQTRAMNASSSMTSLPPLHPAEPFSFQSSEQTAEFRRSIDDITEAISLAKSSGMSQTMYKSEFFV